MQQPIKGRWPHELRARRCRRAPCPCAPDEASGQAEACGAPRAAAVLVNSGAPTTAATVLPPPDAGVASQVRSAACLYSTAGVPGSTSPLLGWALFVVEGIILINK